MARDLGAAAGGYAQPSCVIEADSPVRAGSALFMSPNGLTGEGGNVPPEVEREFTT